MRGVGICYPIRPPWAPLLQWILRQCSSNVFFRFDSHIKEHLKDEIGDIKEDEMSDEDLQFHYFRLHDYDGNKKLDGLELMQAMSDYHNESGIQDERETSEEAMASTIDQILSYDDANDDGYIDYPEYIKSQQKLEEKDKGESNKHQ